MGKSIFGHVGALVGIGVLLWGCGSSKSNGSSGDPGQGGAGGSAQGSCEPDTRRCDGQSVKVCETDGVTETVEITCAQGLRCVEQGRDARCDTRACIPGEALCAGSVATTCAADGAGPKPSGTDCSELGQMCTSGKCLAVTCEAGAVLCSSGDVYRCGKDGKSVTLLDDCNQGEACDTESAKCLPVVCQPNQRLCEGTVAKTCNASGSAWLPDAVDCADEELNCVAGKCSSQICVPAHSFCHDDNVVQCALDGESFRMTSECDHDSQHCEASSGGFAFCYSDVCMPGVVGCDKNSVKTCNDDGFFPLEGESCGDGWCVDGECIERNCESGAYFCEDSDVYYCDYDAPPLIASECGEGTVCRSAGASGLDMPYVFCGELSCVPGVASCLNNQVGECGEDGESLADVTTDCGADDQVCTTEAKCAAAAIDLIGADEMYQQISDAFVGNLIEVTSPRTLTQMRAWMVFQSARQVRWVIYEQTGTAFVAKIDKVVNVPTGSGFIASPAFSFQLQTGKRYLLGLAVSGGDVQVYFDTAPYPSPSFGLVLGQFWASYAAKYDYLDTFNHDGILQLEVTTEAP